VPCELLQSAFSDVACCADEESDEFGVAFADDHTPPPPFQMMKFCSFRVEDGSCRGSLLRERRTPPYRQVFESPQVGQNRDHCYFSGRKL
jgi:hypothetical protein